MSATEFLNKLVGRWQGTCRIWFDPDVLANTAAINGEFETLLNGRFVRHVYDTEVEGKPTVGEETIGYNAITEQWQVAWIDSYHMRSAIMWSEGEGTKNGFSVIGGYDVGPDERPWGWRTVYKLIDNDHLMITAYNITPDGLEAKGVETVYARVL